jgi:hypothetical protein
LDSSPDWTAVLIGQQSWLDSSPDWTAVLIGQQSWLDSSPDLTAVLVWQQSRLDISHVWTAVQVWQQSWFDSSHIFKVHMVFARNLPPWTQGFEAFSNPSDNTIFFRVSTREMVGCQWRLGSMTQTCTPRPLIRTRKISCSCEST